MQLPVIRGLIDRRVLVNFRVESDLLARLLPDPFRPQLVDGYGMAGICLIRLKHVRPRGLPAWLGISSENAAHRIAVEWEEDGQTRCGVYVPRRDTSNYLNVAAGGRIFPGVHHKARFQLHETAERCRIEMHSIDGDAHLVVDGIRSDQLPRDSVFASVDEASQFFEAGSLGYSPQQGGGSFEGLELRSYNWSVQPLTIHHVASSYFDDTSKFPPGSVTFDHALLMRGIEHEWHVREEICCRAPVSIS